LSGIFAAMIRGFKFILYAVLCLSLIQVSNAQTFTRVIGATMPDVSVSTYTLGVAGLPTTSNSSFGFYELNLNIAHSNASELSIKFVSPAGTNFNLLSYLANPNAIGNCTFRILANQGITQINGPISGVMMPDAPQIFDLLNGQDPNGTYSLEIADLTSSGNQCTVNSISIKFINNPLDSTVRNFSTAIPMAKINTAVGFIPSGYKENGTFELLNNLSNSFANTGTLYNIAVEKQGFTSASGPKFNMDISFKTSNYTTDSAISILGLNPESDYILKGAVTDQYLIKDAFTFEMSRRMGYYAPYTRFVELMVNNQYQGLYILTEKIKRGPTRANLNKLDPTSVTWPNISGGYIFEINPNGKPAAWYSSYQGYQGPNLTNNYEFKIDYPKQSTIPVAQSNYLKSYVDSFENAMADTPAFQNPVSGWRKFADEKSIHNFLIVSEFSNNYDTYARSMYFGKEKNTKGNKIKFGPPWDADRGYDGGTSGWVHINTHGFWVFPFWYVNWRQSDSLFNKRFACRYHTARKYHLSDSSALLAIDSLYNTIKFAGERNRIFYNAYFSEISNLKNYVVDRFAWMDANLDSLTFPPNPLTNTTIQAGSLMNINIGNQYTYNFKPGPDTSIFIPTVPGDYIAQVSSIYGCQTRQEFKVIAPIPLGINSIVLEANQTNTKPILNWTCSAVMPGDIFEIQVSNDGTNFKTLKQVNALDNKTTYSSIVFASNSFYRIAQVSKTAHTIFSNIINLAKNASTQGLTVYPNPAQKTIHINAPKATLFNITTVAGQQILSGKLNDEQQVDISAIPNAQYVLQIIDEDGLSESKVFSVQH
jgi:subtilisin-like proprotein convertase family protein